MISARKINLEGLELYGNRPISPRTRAFCQEHDIQITQKDGVVSITRSFILSRAEVDDFLRAKANSPAPTTQKMPSAPTTSSSRKSTAKHKSRTSRKSP